MNLAQFEQCRIVLHEREREKKRVGCLCGYPWQSLNWAPFCSSISSLSPCLCLAWKPSCKGLVDGDNLSWNAHKEKSTKTGNFPEFTDHSNVLQSCSTLNHVVLTVYKIFDRFWSGLQFTGLQFCWCTISILDSQWFSSMSVRVRKSICSVLKLDYVWRTGLKPTLFFVSVTSSLHGEVVWAQINLDKTMPTFYIFMKLLTISHGPRR